MGTLLNATTLARYQARITRLEATLEILYETYDDIASRQLEEYRIDTEDGAMQKGRVQNLNKIDKQIHSKEAELDALYRRINGRGVTNLVLRRNRSITC
jgi:hypothetical protein